MSELVRDGVAVLSAQEMQANYLSHTYGEVDDCTRCIYCEIGEWNGHKENCFA